MVSPKLERILYVEDEDDIRTVARLALEIVGGYTIAVCDSGHNAPDMVKSFRPDLIMLDVMMPVLDGPATLAVLRSNPETAGPPIVFLTAKARASEIERYRALGAIGTLAKPFDPMALAEQVRLLWQDYHAAI